MSIHMNDEKKTAYRVTPAGYFWIAYDEAVRLLKLGKAHRVYG